MADTRIIRFLETTPLCLGFTQAQLESLANILLLQLVPPRGTLFKEGDPGDAFYFIQEGEVGVYKQIPGAGLERLAVLGPREPIGHLCLIDGQARSATCVAHTRTLVLRGDKRLFDRLFNQGDALAFRFIDSVSRDLCKKLRATNQRLYDLYSHPEETAARLRQVASRLARTMEQDCDRVEVVRQVQREGMSRRRAVGV
jgi:CRP-like cAMP-binding protein